MKNAVVAIRRPLAYALFAFSFLLLVLCSFLYSERKKMQEQNMQLIITNDSIISVNILLSDSLKKLPMGSQPKKSIVMKTTE